MALCITILIWIINYAVMGNYHNSTFTYYHINLIPVQYLDDFCLINSIYGSDFACSYGMDKTKDKITGWAIKNGPVNSSKIGAYLLVFFHYLHPREIHYVQLCSKLFNTSKFKTYLVTLLFLRFKDQFFFP